jgi:SagB-type dehydrogenase family enzyme
VQGPLDEAHGQLAPTISELFHENTRQRRSDRHFVERIIAANLSPLLREVLHSAQKRYPSAPRVQLPLVGDGIEAAFDSVVLARRSERSMSGEALTLGEVSRLLRLTNGVTTDRASGGPPFRAAPSGGALFPAELYLVSLEVNGLATGLYHYLPGDHELEEVSPGRHAADLVAITSTPEIAQAAVVLVITGIPARTHLKYGDRGYRFLLLEAGHIAQNALLTTCSTGLSAFTVGGFIDDELDDLLGIDGVDEISLYLVVIGRPLVPSGVDGLPRPVLN